MSAARKLPIAFAILAAAFAAPLRAQDAETLDWGRRYATRIVETRETGFRLELANGNEGRLRSRQARIGRMGYIAAPKGAIVRWTIAEAEWRIWNDGIPSKKTYTLADFDPQADLPPQMRAGSARFVDLFRGVGMYACDFTVGAYPGGSTTGRSFAVIERATYDIAWEGAIADGATTPEALAERDPFLLDFGGETVLNPEQLAAAWRADDAPARTAEWERWSRTLAEASKRGPVLMLKAVRPGIHAISPRDLSAAGIDPLKLDASLLAAYIDGEPVPLGVENLRSGPFVGDMAVWLDVPFSSAERTPFVPVWLMHGEESARLRHEAPQRVPGERDEAAKATTTVEILEPNVYDPANPFTERTGRWCTAVCRRGALVAIPFHLAKVAKDREARIVLSLGGHDRQASQIVEVSVNGTVVGPAEKFAGVGPQMRECVLPAGLLREGENTLHVRYPDERDSALSGSVSVSWAEVTVPLSIGDLPFGTPIRIESSADRLVVAGVEHPSKSRFATIYGVDRTDPSARRPLRAVYRGTSDDVQKFEVTVPVGPSGACEIVLAAPDNAARFPWILPYAHEELVAPKDGADYLIVADRRFVPSLAPLIRSRETRGMTVRVLPVDAIDAVFGHGRHGYRSIEEALRHAWSNWPGRRFSQVVMVGEASEYWWEHRRARPGVSENMVPIHGFAEPTTDIRGDDRYARVSGSGALPDFEIGRVSVPNVAQFEAFRTKLAGYESAPPAGPWLTRHLFFADDEAEFGAVGDKIARLELSEGGEAERHYLQNYPWEDYFRLGGRKRSTAMTDVIVDSMSRGALTATYLGHGGPNLWSGERIFHYRDIPSIHSRGRFPIMTAASCNTAWIDYPDGIVTQSIGEQFLAAPDAGCIALFAPVSGTNSQEHDILLRPFFEGLVGRRFDTVGRAALFAKLEYMLERNQGYVPEQFVLLGDPATLVPRPTERMALTISPSAVFASEPATVAVSGSVADMAWGLAEGRLMNLQGDDVVPPVRAEVADGKFALSFAVPPALEEGRHRLVVHAWNEGEGRHERKEYALRVVGPDTTLEWTADPPPSVATAPGTPVALRLAATLAPGYDLENVRLSIRNVTADTELTSGTVRIGAGKLSAWDFKIPTPDGVTVLEATTRFEDAAKGVDPIATSRIVLFGRRPDGPPVAVSDRLAKVKRLASPDRVEFTIPVYNVGTEPVRIASGELRAGDAPIGAGSAAGELKPGESTDIVLATVDFLPSGRRRFDFVVKGSDATLATEIAQTFPLELEIPPGADLAILGGSVATERRDYQKGETVFVRAVAQNLSDQVVEGASADLYVDVPWDSAALAKFGPGEIARFAIPGKFLPGEKRDLRLRWDPPGSAPESARLYVVVNADRKVHETVWSNNVGDTDVSFRRLPNLAIEKGAARVSSEHIGRNDVVSLTIPIVNDSPYDFAHPHIAEIEALGGGEEPQVVYREHLAGLDAGERAVLQASWKADGRRDRLAVSINAEREFGESDASDNVVSFDLEYVAGWRSLVAADGSWTFDGLFPECRLQSVYVGADSSLALAPKPAGSTTLSFDNKHLVEGEPLPEGRPVANDNRMSIVEGGLIWSAEETPEPVAFRIPLPADDRTTLYDIQFSHSATTSVENRPANVYAWSLEGVDGEIDYPKRSTQAPYIGRVETVDDFLDVRIVPTQPASNSIYAIFASPVSGTVVSPWIEIERLAECVLDAKADVPEGARILFEMRTGAGTRMDPQFGDWREVAVGDRIAAQPDARLLQWRATLVGAATASPALHSLSLRFGDAVRAGGGS